MLASVRRAYVLSPFDAQLAGILAGRLLESGERAAARDVALALRAGGLLLHEVESNLLLVRVEASETRFRAAYERARGAGEISIGDSGFVRVQRFRIAWQALELAVVLGRPREVADWLIARFLDPDPPLLDSHFESISMQIPAICMLASMPARCFKRYRSLRAQLGANTQDTDGLVIGAEWYVKGDYSRASHAWASLGGRRLALASALPDAMVDAFERTNAVDLAEEVDQEVMKRAWEFNGATLGHVRSARRALARGDREGARQLAEQVIDAWSQADDKPPALAEMRQIVSRLERP